MLVFTLALTACNKTQTLTQELRWNGYEKNIYKIGLQLDAADVNNTKSYDEHTFTRDNVTTADGYDRIKPIAVDGTFVTELTINEDGTATYTTVQEVKETYALNDYVANFVDEFAYKEENAFLNATVDYTNQTVTLENTTTSSVTFTNNVAQTPVESTQTIKGYYIGEREQLVNNVTYSTVYADGVATVSIDGVEKRSTELADGVVDALQIPLVVRSIDQSKSTADGKYVAPTVSVYDCKMDKTLTLSLTIYSNMGVLLNLDNDFDKEDEHPYAAAAVTTVGVQGYNGYLYTFTANLKETYETEGYNIPTYNQVRFQSEYYTFELVEYSEDQIEDLKYVAAPKTEK